MFRIDPIKEDGSIDVDFYASDDYTKYRKALERYLEAEGFHMMQHPGGFMIWKFNHLWNVFVDKSWGK